MMKITLPLCVISFFLTTACFPQTDVTNTTWIIPITFSNPGNPSVRDTFGVGIGYTRCLDNNSKLPYLENELPPMPPVGATDARFFDDLSGDPDCLGLGVRMDIHAGDFLTAVNDTFEYQFQVANRNVPWYITWDTTNIRRKVSSLVIQDALTGSLLSVNMLTTDSITITKTSPAKNIAMFYIYATWKPIEPVFCQNCYSPVLFLSTSKIDFGRVGMGHSRDKTLTLRNIGNLTLNISTIVSTTALFTISGSTRSIAPDDSAKYTIRFTPADEDFTSASVVITSNSPSSPDSVNLIANFFVGVPDPLQLPRFYALHQNYPNPFNPSTIISYDLPSKEHVSLRVYNILGQKVASLVNGVQEAGYKSVKFTVADLPSGVYMYRLTAGNFIDTKKMLLLR
jgi:hypothetical protein